MGLRIAFAISTLGSGGAERAATTLGNAWCAAGHDVGFVVFSGPREPCHYPLDPGIAVHRLDLLRDSTTLIATAANTARRVRALRNAFLALRPDVVVSFITEMNTLAICATRGTGIPIAVSERTHPEASDIDRLRRIARDLSYRFADRIVVQSAMVRDWYETRLGLPSVVLPNPIDLGQFAAPAGRHFTTARGRIVSIGRLNECKGHDTVIDAFAEIAPQHPGWRLEVYGTGDRGAQFERQIACRGLGGRARLMGVSSNVAGILGDADLFLIGSRYEGYPNVIIEALACGCPVIATNCPGATAEILGGGRHGVLVPVGDPAAMAAAMSGLINSADRRKSLSAGGPAAVAHLAKESIAERWIEIFEGVSR